VKSRKRARGWALQALYAWDSRGAGTDGRSLVDQLREFMAERQIAPDSRAYVSTLVTTFAAHRDEVDDALTSALTNWRLNRLSFIDRNILRLAATEMLFIPDVPRRVSIQEAILLAERYGTPESPRFVNGVLDALLHRLEPREERDRG
jgi:transcription antitermination protein NusB